MSLFATLPQRGDLIVFDALVHASAHEGMRLSRAECRPAAHNDATAFADAIREWRATGGRGRVWIAAETLYSMDGDRAPLAELIALADAEDAFLLLNEAHATGVFGPAGKGCASALEILEDEPERRVRLRHLTDLAAQTLTRHGATASGSQILPLILGDEVRTMQVAERLRRGGFDVRGIRPPTVPVGTARLRISITLNITEDAIHGLDLALTAALA